MSIISRSELEVPAEEEVVASEEPEVATPPATETVPESLASEQIISVDTEKTISIETELVSSETQVVSTETRVVVESISSVETAPTTVEDTKERNYFYDDEDEGMDDELTAALAKIQ